MRKFAIGQGFGYKFRLQHRKPKMRMLQQGLGHDILEDRQLWPGACEEYFNGIFNQFDNAENDMFIKDLVARGHKAHGLGGSVEISVGEVKTAARSLHCNMGLGTMAGVRKHLACKLVFRKS